MWIEHGFEHLTLEQPTGLTIGAFDGVHLGHQALIRWLVANARGAGWAPVVLTFDPLPRQVFDPDAADLLSDLDDRLPMFADLGVDGVVVQPFDEEVAAIPPRAFAAQLRTHLNLRGLWVGPDFALGRERTGDVVALQAIGEEQGFEVHVFDEVVRWGGAPVRSSRIRRAVRAGDVATARGCLGRPYRLTGQVARGDQRGRTLGFPTANLHLPSARLTPAHGVYICRAHLARGSFRAITNVGTRPTFNHRPPRVEAYLMDFSERIYGERLQLDFLHRLRDERKFESAEALIRQMHRDEAEARAWFAKHEYEDEKTRQKAPSLLAGR